MSDRTRTARTMAAIDDCTLGRGADHTKHHLRDCPYTIAAAIADQDAWVAQLVEPLVEAAAIVLTRIESALLDGWKGNDVDWFAIERLTAALAAFREGAKG